MLRQEQFLERHAREWDEFERWLDTSAKRARKSGVASPRQQSWQGDLRDEDMPAAYRRLCQQLALAQKRGYGPHLQARLQSLMQRGHDVLYRTPPARGHALVHLLGARFPQQVRTEWRFMLASLLLFVIPLVGMFVLVLLRPEWIHSVFSPQQVASFESMYDPADAAARLGRDNGTDVQMFGHYVFNNISIGFRTFASGLLAGIGSAIVLALNGVMIGSVAGYLQAIGHGGPFWRFVAGHGAFELTAIVISGGAGLLLGWSLLAPGRRRRRDALVDAGRRGGVLVCGAFAMLLVAAFIEAFWSSIGWMPASVKFSVAAVLWSGVLLWLWRGGRGAAHAA